ncbi:MAG: LamG domain-containing protein, partial [Symploca sp. SIO2D2]|nr:LamG domain-containing protein [Symploca sp. SIO2D2]
DRETAELIDLQNKELGGEKTDFTFYQGMSPLHQALAPNTFGTSYTIDVYLDREHPDSEGVLVAHGGSGGGYTLYINENNKLAYEYNYLGFERFKINPDLLVPTGKSKVTYKFTKKGDYTGTGQLFLNDELIGEAEISKTVPASFGLEFFDVGQDTQSPVSEAYKPTYTFNDSIEKVTVHIEPEDESGK